MEFIWKKEYETGIDKIDSQHIKIVKLINKLNDTIRDSSEDTIISGIILDLKIYAISHLVYEEKLFKKYNYSGDDFEKHKKTHDNVRKQISDFIGNPNYLPKELAYKISLFLIDWLKNHINETDMKFTKFLKSTGTYEQ